MDTNEKKIAAILYELSNLVVFHRDTEFENDVAQCYFEGIIESTTAIIAFIKEMQPEDIRNKNVKKLLASLIAAEQVIDKADEKDVVNLCTLAINKAIKKSAVAAAEKKKIL